MPRVAGQWAEDGGKVTAMKTLCLRVDGKLSVRKSKIVGYYTMDLIGPLPGPTVLAGTDHCLQRSHTQHLTFFGINTFFRFLFRQSDL